MNILDVREWNQGYFNFIINSDLSVVKFKLITNFFNFIKRHTRMFNTAKNIIKESKFLQIPNKKIRASDLQGRDSFRICGVGNNVSSPDNSSNNFFSKRNSRPGSKLGFHSNNYQQTTSDSDNYD